jgi:uncharacterized Fe-S cluster-containing radical SAM superfamily protein
MYDPLKLSKQVERAVCKNLAKKYYRYRATQFYGGCATFDCVGCNLRCAYCWAQQSVWRTDRGKLYSPQEVASKLVELMQKNGFSRCRISGGEPTIGKQHLLKVIELIPSEYLFILETNGVLLDQSYARDLSKFENLHVRISLKGADAETFSRITGAIPKAFELQIEAMKNLERFGVKYHPALMEEFVDEESLRELRERLAGINPRLPSQLEFETLILYPFVRKEMERRGLGDFLKATS